ncbi:hypothetical protein PN836_012715 [Ningiella sp. W23]|uniref:hypothetical protein n=1 Tax=Ningiella sp. W23 TaxID=3023715 RepID=UPI0037572736
MPVLNPANLKHAFSASQYVQTSSEVLFPERLTTRAQWIVGRSQCLYRVFELSDTPKKNRDQALALQVKRWAPFSRVGFHFIWNSSKACVWAWDLDSINKTIEEVGIQAISVLPESVYYPQEEGRCARWISSVDSGEIFQLWIDGTLAVEKWFPSKPSSTRFDLFLRSLNLPNDLNLAWEELVQVCEGAPKLGQLSRLPAPWGAKNKTLSLIQKLPWEHNVLLIFGVVLVIAYIWMLTATVLASNALKEVNQRADSIADSVESILQARTTAETLNAETRELLSLIDYPLQRALIDDAAVVFNKFNLTLKEWNFKGATLEIVSEGQVNTLNVVQDFENLSWIDSVSVSSARRPLQNRFVLTLSTAEQ